MVPLCDPVTLYPFHWILACLIAFVSCAIDAKAIKAVNATDKIVFFHDYLNLFNSELSVWISSSENS
jgi:hypothetical protein